MKIKIKIWLMTLIIFLFLTVNSNKGFSIVITGFSPTIGCPGDSIFITGIGFGIVTNKVFINNLPAPIIQWTDVAIDVLVPAGAVTGPIKVSNSIGETATTVSNLYIPDVGIVGFSPSQAMEGDTITIMGTGFCNIQGTGFINIGGQIASGIITWSDFMIEVAVPVGATNAPIIITNFCGSGASTSSNLIIGVPALVAVVVYSVNVISFNQIDIIWSDASFETSYTLFRHTANDTNGPIAKIQGFSSDITNYNDIGLLPGTTYYYWVKAYNMQGQSGFSAIVSNTTLWPPPPAKVTNIIATPFSKNRIDLTWTDVNNETSYTLFRSLNNDTNTASSIAGLLPNKANYIDKGLHPATTYYYWVRAYSFFGSSIFSDPASATTLAEGRGASFYMKRALFDVSKGEIPEFIYVLDENQLVTIKGRIINLTEGGAAYETPEKNINKGEFKLIWEEADSARNGVYLVEFLIKRLDQQRFKTVARERFIIIN